MQFLATDSLARMFDQVHQQFEFVSGDCRLTVSNLTGTTDREYRQVSDLKSWVAGIDVVFLPQVTAETCQQHSGTNGLDDVVIGDAVQPEDFIPVGGSSRYDDDGPVIVFTQTQAQAKSVDIRRVDIQHDDRRRFLLNQFHGGSAGTNGSHSKIVGSQIFADNAGHDQIVFHEHDAVQGKCSCGIDCGSPTCSIPLLIAAGQTETGN